LRKKIYIYINYIKIIKGLVKGKNEKTEQAMQTDMVGMLKSHWELKKL
jgi:hypothetical protein